MLVYPALHHTQAPGGAVPAKEAAGKGEMLGGTRHWLPAALRAPRLPGTDFLIFFFPRRRSA